MLRNQVKICVIFIMPCALTSNADYPDYLKSILSAINAGDDNQLKACACQLGTPLSQDGCPILDEDGKLGAFPFCIPEAPNSIPCENGGGNAPFLSMFNEISLKNLMRLYWTTQTIDVAFSAEICTNKRQTLKRSTTEQKRLVCKDFNFNGFNDFKYDVPCQQTSPSFPVGCQYDYENLGILVDFNSNSIFKIDSTFYIKSPRLYYSRTKQSFRFQRYMANYKPAYFSACGLGAEMEVPIKFGNIFTIACNTFVDQFIGGRLYVSVPPSNISISLNTY